MTTYRNKCPVCNTHPVEMKTTRGERFHCTVGCECATAEAAADRKVVATRTARERYWQARRALEVGNAMLDGDSDGMTNVTP